MSNKPSRTELFEHAPVHKAFFALALPSVFGKIIMLLYNLADTWFIASTDNADMVAGVALVSPVFMVMIALGDIFGVGGSSLISRLMGQQRKEDTKRISAMCFYGALLLGGILAFVLLAIKEPLLTLLGTDSDTYRHASDYYTYIILGTPLILTCNTPMNLLRTEGMAKASMIGSMTGSICNIILDPIFIFGLNMGAAGAAIATVIANAIALCVYSSFYRKAEWITISLKHFHIDIEDIKNISAIGIPAALNNLMNSFAMAMTNRVLVPFGNNIVASWSLSGRCTMISTMLLVSFSFSSLPLIGYNFGKKNFDRLKKILKFIYTFEITLAICCAIVMSIFAPHLISMFMDNPIIVSTGANILRHQLLGIAFSAIILISTCIFQATGNGKATMISTLSRQGFIFLPILFTVSHLFGFHGVLFAQPITDFLTAILIVFILYRTLKKSGII